MPGQSTARARWSGGTSGPQATRRRGRLVGRGAGRRRDRRGPPPGRRGGPRRPSTGSGRRGRPRWAGECRDVEPGEDLLAGEDIDAAHATGEDRLAFRLGEGPQPLGGGERAGDRTRGERDVEAVGVRVVRGHGDGPGEAVGVGVGVVEDVDGVGPAPARREEGVERADGLGGEVGQLAAVGDQGVGGDGAAGVGDDGRSRAARGGLLAEDLGHVEEVGEVAAPDDAALPERGVEGLVLADRERLVDAPGPAGLQDDDRLGGGDPAGCPQERGGVAERPHEADRLRRGGAAVELGRGRGGAGVPPVRGPAGRGAEALRAPAGDGRGVPAGRPGSADRELPRRRRGARQRLARAAGAPPAADHDPGGADRRWRIVPRLRHARRGDPRDSFRRT